MSVIAICPSAEVESRASNNAGSASYCRPIVRAISSLWLPCLLLLFADTQMMMMLLLQLCRSALLQTLSFVLAVLVFGLEA